MEEIEMVAAMAEEYMHLVGERGLAAWDHDRRWNPTTYHQILRSTDGPIRYYQRLDKEHEAQIEAELDRLGGSSMPAMERGNRGHRIAQQIFNQYCQHTELNAPLIPFDEMETDPSTLDWAMFDELLSRWVTAEEADDQ